MKIVQIGSFPLDIDCINGGVEASVYGLSKLQSLQESVEVIDFPRKEIKADFLDHIAGLNVNRFSNKRGKNILTIFRVAKIVRIINIFTPEVCHLHATSFFSLVLFVFLKLKGFKVIITVHGLAHIEKRNLFKRKKSLHNLLKYLFQSFCEFLLLSLNKKIIVDTNYVAAMIHKYKSEHKIFRVPKCYVIPQGIDDFFFQLKDNYLNKYQILSVGAINKRKGQIYLVEIMSQLIKKYPDLHLSIAGVISDLNYYEALISEIENTKLNSNIIVYPNASISTLINLYQNSGIFILHSEEESQGIALCEALAVGMPVLATKVGGIPDVIENEKNGFLSDFGNIDDFVNNITMLLTYDKLYQNIVERNKFTSLKYSWKIIGDEVMKVYLD